MERSSRLDITRTKHCRFVVNVNMSGLHPDSKLTSFFLLTINVAIDGVSCQVSHYLFEKGGAFNPLYGVESLTIKITTFST